ncbi:hypothetical protein R3P38DRAFT_3217249 [Favolaschia claudopus]|uniref:Uncharacterized protein n=1 Tax=Favolaschia claudopus TaxID=2862362 RepID=A0AAW0A4Q0_9AGAR
MEYVCTRRAQHQRVQETTTTSSSSEPHPRVSFPPPLPFFIHRLRVLIPNSPLAHTRPSLRASHFPFLTRLSVTPSTHRILCFALLTISETSCSFSSLLVIFYPTLLSPLLSASSALPSPGPLLDEFNPPLRLLRHVPRLVAVCHPFPHPLIHAAFASPPKRTKEKEEYETHLKRNQHGCNWLKVLLSLDWRMAAVEKGEEERREVYAEDEERREKTGREGSRWKV